MADKTIMNVLQQPLHLNLSGERTRKIRARETVEIDEADLQSPELMFHQHRGHIVVIEKPAVAAAPAAPATAAPATAAPAESGRATRRGSTHQ